MKNILKSFLNSCRVWNLIQGPVYNNVAPKALQRFYKEIACLIQTKENMRMLDVGSGPGFLTIQIAKNNPTASVIGIDYSSKEIKFANKLKIRNQIHNCIFKQANAMELPFEDNSFDFVVSVASIKHWPDIKRGLHQIKRVLKTGSFSLIAEADRQANPDDISEFAHRLKAWYVSSWFMRWYLKNAVFGCSYTESEIGRIAKEVGFKQVLAEKISDWPFFLLTLYK